MKSGIDKSTVLLTLPVIVIVVAGLIYSRWRQEKERIFYEFFAQPLQAKLSVERSKLPKGAVPGTFVVAAHSQVQGAQANYRVLMRARLFEIESGKRREIWNSETQNDSPRLDFVKETTLQNSTCEVPGIPQPCWQVGLSWQFRQLKNDKRESQFEVESVVIPLKVPRNQLGNHGISLGSYTDTEIRAARKQAGARYSRSTLNLRSTDNGG